MNIRRRVKKIFKAVMLTLLILLAVVNLPIISIKNVETNMDYSNWMKENLGTDILITDVQMIGAHDAFSKDIGIFSKVDKLSAPSIMTGIPGTLIKGFLVRQSVTQIADTDKLLSSGIRYLDIRLTKTNDIWETKHNFIASDYKNIAADIVSFLDNNKGEFLILDFQHLHGVDYSSVEDYLSFYKVLEDYGLAEYSYFNNEANINTLTYGEITNDKSISKVIIVDKFDVPNKQTYNYQETIRSNWANSDNFEEVLEFLETEKTNITENSDVFGFKVMQAVTTMNMSPKGILNSFKTWSLVERGEKFNKYLLEYNELEGLMDVLPIVMVDYATQESFVDEMMDLIIENNQ